MSGEPEESARDSAFRRMLTRILGIRDTDDIDLDDAFAKTSHFMRLLGVSLGFVLILIGIWFVVKFASFLVGGLIDPSSMSERVGQVNDIIGGEALRMQVGVLDVSIGRLVSLFVLAAGTLIGVAVCLAVIRNGSRIIRELTLFHRVRRPKKPKSTEETPG